VSARLDAQFLTSASSIEDAPRDAVPEVAFIGRSNSGKSSVLNCLTGQTKLARTSKTPGRTQRFNYFEARNLGRLVDLPGYGFAKVSRRVTSAWQRNIVQFLEHRAQLSGLVLVMDARHPFRASDLEMMRACESQQLPVLALLNKSDKLSKSAKINSLRAGSATLASHHLESAHVLTFSARSGEGADEARDWIRTKLQSP